MILNNCHQQCYIVRCSLQSGEMVQPAASSDHMWWWYTQKKDYKNMYSLPIYVITYQCIRYVPVNTCIQTRLVHNLQHTRRPRTHPHRLSIQGRNLFPPVARFLTRIRTPSLRKNNPTQGEKRIKHTTVYVTELHSRMPCFYRCKPWQRSCTTSSSSKIACNSNTFDLIFAWL